MSFLRIFSFITILFTLISCATTTNLVFNGATPTTDSFELTEIDFDGLQVLIPYSLQNDQTADITVTSAFWNLVIAGDTLMTHDIQTIPAITAGESVDGHIKIPIQYEMLLNRFGSFGQLTHIPAIVHASFDAVPTARPELTRATQSISTEIAIPALQTPEIHIDTLILHSFNLAVAELEVRLRIVNPNPFPVSVSETQFAVTVDGTNWHTQSINQRFEVPIRSDIVINAPFSMRPRDFNTDVYRKLNMSQEFEYHVRGSLHTDVHLDGFLSPQLLNFHKRRIHQFERLSN